MGHFVWGEPVEFTTRWNNKSATGYSVSLACKLIDKSPREWAESQGLEWLALSAGKEWVVSLKEKTEHRILLVCEMKLKPEAPAGTQPYILLGVRMQLKEAAIEEGRKRIPAGLQL